MANDDVLSLSMFWAGALMAFTPMLCAAVVLAVWWRQRGKPPGPRDERPRAPRPERT